MSAAQRTRGHNCERAVARYLRRQGFDGAKTTRQMLGHDGAKAPGDVSFHPLIVLEVKDVAGSSWPSWCRQAANEAPEGAVPAVVRRTRGVPDPGLWECRVRAWEWIHILDGEPLRSIDDHKIVVHDDGDWWPWKVLTLAALVVAVRSVDTQETT